LKEDLLKAALLRLLISVKIPTKLKGSRQILMASSEILDLTGRDALVEDGLARLESLEELLGQKRLRDSRRLHCLEEGTLNPRLGENVSGLGHSRRFGVASCEASLVRGLTIEHFGHGDLLSGVEAVF
jgi:hypothetical protein